MVLLFLFDVCVHGNDTNREEEELFRENQKKMFTEGSVWQQAGKVMEQAGPAKKAAAPRKTDAADSHEDSADAAPRDTSRMRQLLTNLKQ